MTKDDKCLRETVLAELRRRRNLLGRDADRPSTKADEGYNGARAERDIPAASAGEPRLDSRTSQASLPIGTTSR